jgi:hypothetical protein
LCETRVARREADAVGVVSIEGVDAVVADRSCRVEVGGRIPDEEERGDVEAVLGPAGVQREVG